MTLKRPDPPPRNFSPSNSTNEVNTCTFVYGAAAVYNVRSSFPVAQLVEHGVSNAKIMGSIPRESKSW